MRAKKKRNRLVGALMTLLGAVCALILCAVFYGTMVYQLAGENGESAPAAAGTLALNAGTPVDESRESVRMGGKTCDVLTRTYQLEDGTQAQAVTASPAAYIERLKAEDWQAQLITGFAIGSLDAVYAVSGEKAMLCARSGDRVYMILAQADESALYALLHTLSLYFPPERLSTGKAMLLRNTFDAVEKIVQYIDANYMQKITLNDLAQVSKYNRNYISQFFKSNLGVNFHDYLTRIRLREATLALSQTNQSVSEIALSHGFSDLKSFNTVFRARFSKTPTEYRRQLNETVTKYDPRFKRDFLPRADEAMNQILLQYMLDPGQPAEPPPAGADTPLQRVAETSLRLKELTQGLPQTAAGLEKILWELSQ